MGRFCSGQWLCIVLAVAFVTSCGGSKPPAPSPFPARITLSPPGSASLQQGKALLLIATAQNGSGATISPAFTFTSSDPSVLTISPNGIVCGGIWNAPSYTICTPGGVGAVEVTATALGATSSPTLIFVHAPIDNIQVNFVPPVNSPPPACPTQIALPAACNVPFNGAAGCFSQNQVQTLQAQAFSQGSDITASVGPFTWSESSSSVVTVTPIIDPNLHVATSQATATPNAPGFAHVFATASGLSSQAQTFETCPVQCVTLGVGASSTQEGATSFVVNKGTSQTITATAVDVQGCIVPKPPLTWTSSQPASIVAGSASTGCPAGSTCTATTPQAGAASITASCTPPTCNVGFPESPLALPPVYPVTAVSGLATPSGTTAPTFNILATSLDCAGNPACTVGLYNVSTAKNTAGNAIQVSEPPNSLIFDPAGDKAYMGSQFGAALVNAANLGGSTAAFTTIPAASTPTGKVTGKALATSPNGNVAIFSDTLSTPNQVYVVNAPSPSSASSIPLNISGAVAAAFSRDGLKAFIIGCVAGPVACSQTSGNTLYIYSALEALQSISLAFPADIVVFSSSGTFALVSGGTSAAASALAVNTCNNSTKTLSLLNTLNNQPAFGEPLFLKMVPAANVSVSQIPTPIVSEGLDFFFGLDSTGLDVIATNVAQPMPLFKTLCPLDVNLATQVSNPLLSQNVVLHIPFNQGTFNPIAFFLSPDSTHVYAVTSDHDILIYNFDTGATSAVHLVNSITGDPVIPVSADITPDGSLIYVAASDGTLHAVSTISATDSLQPIGFPPLPNSTNGFCVNGISPVNCTLNLVVARP